MISRHGATPETRIRSRLQRNVMQEIEFRRRWRRGTRQKMLRCCDLATPPEGHGLTPPPTHREGLRWIEE